MKFAHVRPGIWVFGGYRIERFQISEPVKLSRYRLMFHGKQFQEQGSKDDSIRACMIHRRNETLKAFMRAWQ